MLVFFVLVVALANFAIGFGLAVHLGHGPALADLLQYIRPKPPARSAAKSAAAKAKAH
jgi:hypothetical protein